MKPQQQNTDVKGQSHVYVQKPDGEQINIQSTQNDMKNMDPKEARQTAEETPTTHTHETTDGEDA